MYLQNTHIYTHTHTGRLSGLNSLLSVSVRKYKETLWLLKWLLQYVHIIPQTPRVEFLQNIPQTLVNVDTKDMFKIWNINCILKYGTVIVIIVLYIHVQ
jgi:hypothetical protein